MNNTNNNDNKLPVYEGGINWKPLGFFSAEDYLVFVFKKIEKITSAIYLVSGLLKDEEPMKWELRDRGIDLISSSFEASSSIPGDKNAVIQSIFSVALETISILNVAKVSHLISEMNHALLVREIDNIVNLLRERLVQNAESAGYILSESFFKTPTLYSSGFRSDSKKENSQISDMTKGKTDTDIKKSQRQEQIVNILQGQPDLTIKDFSKVIKNCSEKTIQRELLELVQKGVIKKEGERRWSRYSLK